MLLAKIEQENLEAHQSLESELLQLRQAKRSAKAAQQVIFNVTLLRTNLDPLMCFQAAEQSMQHVSVLTAVNIN